MSAALPERPFLSGCFARTRMKLLKVSAVASSVLLGAAFVVFCGTVVLLPSTKSGRVFHPRQDVEAEASEPLAPTTATQPAASEPRPGGT
jgi:hypothetical protein